MNSQNQKNIINLENEKIINETNAYMKNFHMYNNEKIKDMYIKSKKLNETSCNLSTISYNLEYEINEIKKQNEIKKREKVLIQKRLFDKVQKKNKIKITSKKQHVKKKIKNNTLIYIKSYKEKFKQKNDFLQDIINNKINNCKTTLNQINASKIILNKLKNPEKEEQKNSPNIQKSKIIVKMSTANIIKKYLPNIQKSKIIVKMSTANIIKKEEEEIIYNAEEYDIIDKKEEEKKEEKKEPQEIEEIEKEPKVKNMLTEFVYNNIKKIEKEEPTQKKGKYKNLNIMVIPLDLNDLNFLDNKEKEEEKKENDGKKMLIEFVHNNIKKIEKEEEPQKEEETTREIEESEEKDKYESNRQYLIFRTLERKFREIKNPNYFKKLKSFKKRARKKYGLDLANLFCIHMSKKVEKEGKEKERENKQKQKQKEQKEKEEREKREKKENKKNEMLKTCKIVEIIKYIPSSIKEIIDNYVNEMAYDWSHKYSNQDYGFKNRYHGHTNSQFYYDGDLEDFRDRQEVCELYEDENKVSMVTLSMSSPDNIRKNMRFAKNRFCSEIEYRLDDVFNFNFLTYDYKNKLLRGDQYGRKTFKIDYNNKELKKEIDTLITLLTEKTKKLCTIKKNDVFEVRRHDRIRKQMENEYHIQWEEDICAELNQAFGGQFYCRGMPDSVVDINIGNPIKMHHNAELRHERISNKSHIPILEEIFTNVNKTYENEQYKIEYMGDYYEYRWVKDDSNNKANYNEFYQKNNVHIPTLSNMVYDLFPNKEEITLKIKAIYKYTKSGNISKLYLKVCNLQYSGVYDFYKINKYVLKTEKNEEPQKIEEIKTNLAQESEQKEEKMDTNQVFEVLKENNENEENKENEEKRIIKKFKEMYEEYQNIGKNDIIGERKWKARQKEENGLKIWKNFKKYYKNMLRIEKKEIEKEKEEPQKEEKEKPNKFHISIKELRKLSNATFYIICEMLGFKRYKGDRERLIKRFIKHISTDEKYEKLRQNCIKFNMLFLIEFFDNKKVNRKLTEDEKRTKMIEDICNEREGNTKNGRKWEKERKEKAITEMRKKEEKEEKEKKELQKQKKEDPQKSKQINKTNINLIEFDKLTRKELRSAFVMFEIRGYRDYKKVQFISKLKTYLTTEEKNINIKTKLNRYRELCISFGKGETLRKFDDYVENFKERSKTFVFDN